MTITTSILRTGGTSSSVNVYKLDDATFSQVDTEDVKGGKRTVMKIASGDAAHETTIVAQQKQGNDKLTRAVLLAMNTWAEQTDDVTNVTTYRPISAVITLNVPIDIEVNSAQLIVLLENVFSLAYDSVAAGVPDATRIYKLALFGLTDVLQA